MLYRALGLRHLWTGIAASLLVVLSGSARESTAQDSSSNLKSVLEDVDVGDRWSYNDWESARTAALLSKKPILALFR